MGDARDVSWVKPTLVAEVEFSNWTDEKLLRHPSFQGLREDKPAAKVIHDEPISLSEVKAMKTGRKVAVPRRKRVKRTSREEHPPHTRAVDADGSAVYAGVPLSHPDKVLYAGQGITKRDLAEFYIKVADWMLPHVIDRPLAIVRCPAGSGKPCFFQKHPSDGASNHLRQVNISEHGAPEYHLAIDDVSGLIALVQMGVLEIHVWGSRVKELEKPDRLIFDLDPDPSVAWPEVIKAARQVRLLLEELGLTCFLKTTGGKGLHLVVPVQPRTEWEEAKAFCRAVADFMVRADTRPLHCDDEQGCPEGEDFHRLSAKRPRRNRGRGLFHQKQTGRDRERPARLGGADCQPAFRSLHDRELAGSPQQAEERPVGRPGKDQAIDHRGHGEAARCSIFPV